MDLRRQCEPEIQIRTQLGLQPKNLCSFRIANRLLYSDWSSSFSEPFQEDLQPRQFYGPLPRSWKPVVLQGKAHEWFAGQRTYRIRTANDQEGNFYLESNPGGNYWIARDGGWIILDSDRLKTGEIDATLLLGPLLILALALQDCWCLHASAVKSQTGALLLLGPSGAGKSTLARYLAEKADFSWIADDIVPIEILDRELQVLPHFSQLKFPDRRLPAESLVPLAALVRIRARPAHTLLSLRRLRGAETLSVVARQTVANRLFNRLLLTRHLDFATRVGRSAPMYELSLPRGEKALQQAAMHLSQIEAHP